MAIALTQDVHMLWLNFFLIFPRSNFFICWSRYVGTGSHMCYSWVCLREKWMIASFSSCGCDQVPCDVTWLWHLGYQGFCFDFISMLTRSHHLASHTLTALWRLTVWLNGSSFLPSLDCALIIFISQCLFLLYLSDPCGYFWCFIWLPLAK